MKIFEKERINKKELMLLGAMYTPRYYSMYLLFSIITGFIAPIIIRIEAYFIDSASQVNSSNLLTILSGLLLTYFALYLIDLNSMNIVQYFKVLIRSIIEKHFMLVYFEKFSLYEYKEIENSDNQDLFFRIKQTVGPIINQNIDFLPIFLRSVIELVGILYYAIIADTWWVFPISVILSIPSFYFNRKRVLHARNVYRQDNKDMRYADYLHSELTNKKAAKERRLFRHTTFLEDIWEEYFKRYNINRIFDYIKSSVSTGAAMFFSMTNILIFGLCLIEPLINGTITIGTYISVLQMVTIKFNQNINTIIRVCSELTSNNDFINDFNKFQELKTIEANADEKEIIFESIEFDSVWFKYPNTNDYILKGVSFKIFKGQSIALIGLNGAGKTTITKLMLGLYSPNKGNIFINGIPVSKLARTQINNLYAYMEQTPINYKMSMRENICLYHLNELDEDAKLDRLLDKCNMLYLKEKVGKSYDTPLTPELQGGVMLSGGEWQKLTIARQINSNREFYILDEPTASLDPLSEISFYNEFKVIAEGHTCLYITHRLGSTYLFDECLILNEGVIEESGTHDELMKMKDGLYRKLFIEQKKGIK